MISSSSSPTIEIAGTEFFNMTRRCSHCSNNGHNSRTCPDRGVKLFGVRLTDGSIRKSASMGNLSHYVGSNDSHANGSNSMIETPDHGSAIDGYNTDGFVRGRKKGVPWTEEEHRIFLLGLQKLGKGDWRGIARNYVISRTPTQVASHAQKHFIRQINSSRRKRRSSLFDMVADESIDTPLLSQDMYNDNHLQGETQIDEPVPRAVDISPTNPPYILQDEASESMKSTNTNDEQHAISNLNTSQSAYPILYPVYFSSFVPFWSAEPEKQETHEILKPTAVHHKNRSNVDQLIGILKLTLGESICNTGRSLLGSSSRQSAFQANPTATRSAMYSSNNPIHAV